MKKVLSMNLQKFAADLDDDLDLDVDATPVDDDVLEEPIVVVQPTPKPAEDPLAGAAWGNVITLMETQNALLQKNLSGLQPTLEELQSTTQTVKNALDRVNSALDDLAKAKEEQVPQDTDIKTTEEEIAPVERKKGPRWRK